MEKTRTYQFTLSKVNIQANSEKEAIEEFEQGDFIFDYEGIECLGGND
jgi:hypothetical protein